MRVICDNSTLSALAEMGLIDLLPLVVGRVTVPASVVCESRHPGAPPALRSWIASPPDWLIVESDPPLILEETNP